MRLLLDTHTFIWFVSGDKQISHTVRKAIETPSNTRLISIASLWEISIKNSLGKLQLIGGYDSVINDLSSNRIEILPISFGHTLIQNKLPFHHRDPFDRILVAQAISDGLILASADAIFDEYLKGAAIRRFW